MGSYSAFKGHSASGQGDNLDQVHSDHMILKKIWWRRLVRRAIAQHWPRVSKRGFKGPSNCHSNVMAVEMDRKGPVGRIKGLLSQKIYSRRELANSSKT